MPRRAGVIAALFVPAPWPGLILLAIAVTAVAICAWQFFSRCPICEERNCDYGDYGDDEDEDARGEELR